MPAVHVRSHAQEEIEQSNVIDDDDNGDTCGVEPPLRLSVLADGSPSVAAMDTPILPSASHFQHVYEPAEDTFLLMDAIEQDLPMIRNMRPLICLEVGCGSAAVLVAVRKALGSGTWCIGTDVNERAGQASNSCASLNDMSVEIILTDLTTGIEDRLKHCIDLLIFNPPYVPTDPQSGTGIAASWAGGEDGVQVTKRFIQRIPDLLSEEGIFYLVLVHENNIPLLIMDMESLGIDARVCISRRCGREHLSVVSGRRRPVHSHAHRETDQSKDENSRPDI